VRAVAYTRTRGGTIRAGPVVRVGFVRAELGRYGRSQQQGGLWEDAEFTAPGFPRVFYLKYHGYDKYFPLWALARYRNLIRNE
jgi:squalene-hopene/tetraprenyl-beta-curcumene cyclase